MKILVNMKKMGSRRNAITQAVYELHPVPETVRELITQMVQICVRQYNDRMENRELLVNLSKAEIEELASSGKIGFGVNYGEKKAEEKQAVENALQCFEDGIYRIFCGTDSLQSLDEKLSLTEEYELTFVRLVMLAGRMW